jgi:RecB family exonuclease
LLEILVERAEANHWALQPPRIVTIGALPEELYEREHPFADYFVQSLAWIEALKRVDPTRLKSLLPSLPAPGDFDAWIALAEMLGSVHRELAAEDMSFSDVARCGAEIPAFREGPRWSVLAELQHEYLAILDSVALWDRQTARLYAIEHCQCRTDCDVILVGTTDVNRAPRRMLELIADRVTALVVAPAELNDRFDPMGCIRPAAWTRAEIPMRDDQIEVVDAPVDQAAAVVRSMAGFDARFSADDIVVGVPDESLVPYIEEQLSQAGVATRYGPGEPVSRSGPFRLLETLAEYVGSQRWSAFASLVRHPAMHDWLATPSAETPPLAGDWLTALDLYATKHLPHRFPPGAWLGESDKSGLSQETQLVQRLWEGRVQKLIAPFAEGEKLLADWGRPILDFLLDVYGRRPLNPSVEPDRTVLDVCSRVRDILLDHRGVPAELACRVDGPAALRVVLRQLGRASIPAASQRGAVELLGWLELPLDDAPALILSGVNEGVVPQSLNADLFLPNSLRIALGIEDNDRRYARDAYALSVLAASREAVAVIAGRRAAAGDPLTPSRLLFACDQESIARRARRWFGDQGEAPRAIRLGSLRPGVARSSFAPKRPQWTGPAVQSMRVTEFRDYIACKFRYYLRHRLKLSPVSDVVEELPRSAFGSLVHSVLCGFGNDPEAAASTDARYIGARLDDLLDREVAELCGESPLASVLVQKEQIRVRLAAFARWQAGWAAQGWRIEHVEIGEKESEAAIVVNGGRMGLRGRMDRIDVHDATAKRIIFDYKTWDTPRPPDKEHRRADDWVDLQLPLYRYLAQGMGIDLPVGLGYIVLPKDVTKTGSLLASWNDDELAEADGVAADVVRGIWAGEYWPVTSPPPDYSEEFAAICLDRQLGPPVAGPDDEEESE